jgi:hypothetical protein
MAKGLARSPDVRILVGHRDIFREPASETSLRDSARLLEPNWTAGLLAWLGRRFEDGADDKKSQIAIARRVVRPASVRDALVQHLIGCDREALWFGPSVVLFGLRVLAEEAKEGARYPVGASLPCDVLYRWVLGIGQVVTDALGGPAAEGPRGLPAWVGWEIRSWHANASTSAYSIVARTAATLFTEPSEALQNSPDYIDLQDELERVLGISPLAYLSVLVQLYGRLLRLPKAELCVLVEPSHWTDTRLSPEEVARCVDLASTDLSGLARRFRETEQIAGSGVFNVLPFCEKPLLRLPQGAYTCPSMRLLTEHIFDQFYHRLWRSYRAADGRPDNRFTRYWGQLIESYVKRLFGAVLHGSGRLRTVWFADDGANYETPGKQAPDVVVESMGDMAFFEVTSTTLTLRSLCLGDPASIKRDLEHCVIEKAQQLDRCITDYQTGHLTFEWHAPDGAQRVVPIIVTPGFTPSFPPTQLYLAQAIEERGLLEQPRVLPLQVLSLEDLELMMSYVASGFSLAELIGRKASVEQRGHPRSFRQYVRDKELSPPQLCHPVLKDAFNKFFRDIAACVFGAESLPDDLRGEA